MIAAAGTGLRPGRLLYPDGTPVAWWNTGGSGLSFAPLTGRAAGVVLDRRGWQQLVAPPDGGPVEVVHPALVLPAGTRPLSAVPYRDQVRFREFDEAEADGRDSAMLNPAFVDEGDRIRLGPGSENPGAERIVTGRQLTGDRVIITTAGPDGSASQHTFPLDTRVEVLQPEQHPALAGPGAADGPDGPGGPPPGDELRRAQSAYDDAFERWQAAAPQDRSDLAAELGEAWMALRAILRGERRSAAARAQPARPPPHRPAPADHAGPGDHTDTRPPSRAAALPREPVSAWYDEQAQVLTIRTRHGEFGMPAGPDGFDLDDLLYIEGVIAGAIAPVGPAVYGSDGHYADHPGAGR